MNIHSSLLGSVAPVGEVLLAETAIRIELPASLHGLALEREAAVRKHIERADSPLHGKVTWFYPQGSMAIRATIKSRRRADGFDIDIVAELILPFGTSPAAALELLFDAINGPPGSMYHGMVERKARCVTVEYADGMHLDITPSELLDENDQRLSHVFHAKAEEPASAHRRVVMNSWAFCDWFIARTPVNLLFEQAYAERALRLDKFRVLADADVKPVPPHSTAEGGKSSTVVAHQLLKRNRNLRYEKRKGQRMPPSVMMAAFAGITEVPSSSIAGALDAISKAMLDALEMAAREGRLIDVRNPRCSADCFTDRWPENHAAQRTYIDDLKLFRQQLAALMSDDFTLEQKQDLLVSMFGDAPARSAVEEYAKSIGRAVQSGARTIGPSGKVIPSVGVAAPALASSAVAQPRGHTFFGSRWSRR